MAYGYNYEDSSLVLTEEVTVKESTIDNLIRYLVNKGIACLEEICKTFDIKERDMTMPTQEYLRMRIGVIKGRMA